MPASTSEPALLHWTKHLVESPHSTKQWESVQPMSQRLPGAVQSKVQSQLCSQAKVQSCPVQVSQQGVQAPLPHDWHSSSQPSGAQTSPGQHWPSPQGGS